jgi:hypothetical protein
MSARPVVETDALTKRYGAARGIVDVLMSVEAGAGCRLSRQVVRCAT